MSCGQTQKYYLLYENTYFMISVMLTELQMSRALERELQRLRSARRLRIQDFIRQVCGPMWTEF